METYAGPQASYKPKPPPSVSQGGMPMQQKVSGGFNPQPAPPPEVSGQRNGMTYQSDTGGGPPPMQMGGNGINVTAGVKAGLITNPGDHQGAMKGIRNFAANNQANQTYAPDAVGRALADNYNANSDRNTNRDTNAYDLMGTAANAKFFNEGQGQQVKSGGAWAGLGSGAFAQDLALQAQKRAQQMAMLQSLIGPTTMQG